MQHTPAFIQTLAPIVTTYGYFAVGSLILLEDFGIPAPGETVLITAAFYAGLGHLNIIWVIVIGFVAAVIGDNIGFTIGHFGGRPLIERIGSKVFISPNRIAKSEAFFKRHGAKVVVIARFIEGLRQLNGIIAGFSRMPWQRFIVFNAIGAALWVGLWAGVGFFGGNHIETFLHYQLYFSIAIVVIVLLVLGARLFKHRRHNKHGT